MERPLFMRVLASSVYLAGRASNIIRNVVSSETYDIVDKGVNDFQSRADRDAQRCIVGSLSRSFPDLKIVGEEGLLDVPESFISNGLDREVLEKECPLKYASTSLSDMIVWVDPLDGTKEFTEGLVEHVTVLIGIAVNGIPVAGVIAQPFYCPNQKEVNLTPLAEPITNSNKRIVWGLDGLGIFGMIPQLPSTPIPFPLDENATRGAHPHILVITRSHPSPTLSETIEACAATDVVRAGGCGYKTILLLEGCAHAYVFPRSGTKRWDTCAPEAILNTIGGRLTDLFGNQYDYNETKDPGNRNGLLVTAVANWLPIYANRVPKSVLDSL